MEALLTVILAGFMGICGGFGSYGCYRCCTDQETYTTKKSEGFQINWRKLLNLPSAEVGISKPSSPTSSFTGTIYTLQSDDILILDQDKNHDYFLSINPKLIGWEIDPGLNKTGKKRIKTAPN